MMRIDETACCVVGGGPAGMMATLLLGRQGVEVTVLEYGDPEGIVTKLTHTATGKFTAIESDDTVYTGRFTLWFGGSLNSHTTVFTGTFNATGTRAATSPPSRSPRRSPRTYGRSFRDRR